MVYTSEFPEVSGWYWLKRGGEEEIVKVHIFKGMLGRSWIRVGQASAQYASAVKKHGWKWAGPIEKPEAAICAAGK